MPTVLDAAEFSILTPYGYQKGSCGYCKAPNSSGSFYASSPKLTVDHYQTLVDRGWRRSGETLYKPDPIRSCCPHYTIRIPVAQMKPSRDQRQTLHRWNRFVLGDEYMKESAKLHPKPKETKRRQNNEFDLVSTVHESESADLPPVPLTPAHRFEVTLEDPEYTDEKYALFEQYQRLVHNEGPSEISRAGFERFLCTTPLVDPRNLDGDGGPTGLGSRHQTYRLDGRLVALGVVDLLPRAVSAVYLVYDVALERHGFGKLSALREAALALERGLAYYNMGFYIHACAKMRYKCDYKPQQVLDLDSFEWHPLDADFRAKLDAQKFVSPSRERRLAAAAAAADAAMDDAATDDAAPPPAAETYATPAEAARSGDSLLSFGLPGAMSAAATDAFMAASTPLIGLGLLQDKEPRIAPATALRGWDDGSLLETGSLKCAVGELIACVGEEVARRMIVDFDP